METSIKHNKSNDINMHKIFKWLPRSDLWIISKVTIGTSVVLRTFSGEANFGLLSATFIQLDYIRCYGAYCVIISDI